MAGSPRKEPAGGCPAAEAAARGRRRGSGREGTAKFKARPRERGPTTVPRRPTPAIPAPLKGPRARRGGGAGAARPQGEERRGRSAAPPPAWVREQGSAPRAPGMPGKGVWRSWWCKVGQDVTHMTRRHGKLWRGLDPQKLL